MSQARELVLHGGLYPVEALVAAKSAFEQFCQVTSRPTDGGVAIRIEAFAGSPPQTVDEFLSYLLSASMERLLTGSAE